MSTRLTSIIASSTAILAFAGCSVEKPVTDITPDSSGNEVRIISLSFRSPAKSALDGFTPKFCDGDSIRLSNGMDYADCRVSVNDKGEATVTTELSGPLKAIYPYQAAVMTDGAITGFKVPNEQSGTFASANIAVADDITTAAAFVNKTALFAITPPEGTKSLTVISSDKSDAGAINSEGTSANARHSVRVTGHDSHDGKFYVSLLPGVNLSNLTFKTGNAMKIIPLEAIQAKAGAENAISAGTLYTINEDNWQDCPVRNVTADICHSTLDEAVKAASKGDTLALLDGEYTLPNLSDIALVGLGSCVIVTHSTGNICGTSNVVLKNFVFNLPAASYHGFYAASNLTVQDCTINGLIVTYGSTTFKNCTFNQDTYEYTLQAYSNEVVCDSCTFNGKGKAVFVYNEGSFGMYHFTFNKCTFNEEVGSGTKCKAAILVKENLNNQKYVVKINGCVANYDKYVPDDPDLTQSRLWNMEIIDGVTDTDVSVYLDGEQVYPWKTI